jgi:pyruvate dehydrogenase E2 component (dihydrolipoamide acetyltransferase)
MAEVVPMPKLGFDMAEGTLVRKAKPEGERIAKDEVLADIETDKATVEVTAYVGGVIHTWLVNEGQAVPIGTPMVVIAAPGESVDLAALGLATASKPASASAPTPAPLPPSLPAPVAEIPATLPAAGPAPASPIARKMAADANVDLHLIKGTGPGGRVTKKDVEAYLAAPRPAGAKAPPSPLPAPGATVSIAPAAEDQIVPLTKLRQIIARRMTESKQTIPQFYVTTEIDMGAAMALRKQLNALLPETGKISVNDFIVKATALALRQFPNLNATFGGDKIIRKGHINVGVAVAVTGGLLTVVVKDADHKPLAQIAVDVKAMAGRAREGKVLGGDIDGSTFSTSNLGMFDVENFLAIINPPEAAILATGSVREVPMVTNGTLTTSWRMKATCSADHRVTDGAEAAQFLQVVKKNLEEPLRLLL